jgi:hypothetical protein
MSDPILGIAAQRLMAITGIDLKVQLERGTGTRPMLWLLAKAKEKAALSLQMLVNVDPNNAEAIRTLQNDVIMFEDFVEWCRELLAHAKDSEHLVNEADRAELAEYLTTDEAREVGIQQTED